MIVIMIIIMDLAVGIFQGCSSCPLWPDRIEIWNAGFCGKKDDLRKNRKTRRRIGGVRKKATNKINPQVTPVLGIEPRPQRCEASALNTAPFSLPRLKSWPQCVSLSTQVYKWASVNLLGNLLRLRTWGSKKPSIVSHIVRSLFSRWVFTFEASNDELTR